MLHQSIPKMTIRGLERPHMSFSTIDAKWDFEFECAGQRVVVRIGQKTRREGFLLPRAYFWTENPFVGSGEVPPVG